MPSEGLSILGCPVGDCLNTLFDEKRPNLTVGSITPQARVPELCKIGGKELSISKQTWEHGCFGFSLFLTEHMVRLASWSPCLDFPAMMDCNLELWAEINPFFLELLLARAFDHSNRNEAWTSSEVPTCNMPCKTLICLCGQHLHLRVRPGQHMFHLNCFCKRLWQSRVIMLLEFYY